MLSWFGEQGAGCTEILQCFSGSNFRLKAFSFYLYWNLVRTHNPRLLCLFNYWSQREIPSSLASSKSTHLEQKFYKQYLSLILDACWHFLFVLFGVIILKCFLRPINCFHDHKWVASCSVKNIALSNTGVIVIHSWIWSLLENWLKYAQTW